MTNRERFELAKQQLIAEIQGDVHKAAIALQSKIMQKAPVDTGELRSEKNWTMTEESPYSFIIVAGDDPGKIEALEYGLFPNPPKAGKGKTVDGYSRQAPHGFIRISIEEVINEFK